jgi:hypothetical protein
MLERAKTWSGRMVVFLGLVWLGCSGAKSPKFDASADLPSAGSGADVPMAKADASSDKSSSGVADASDSASNDIPGIVCPGHIDSFGGPSLAIRTQDGTPTISSLKLDLQLCRAYYVGQSYGDVGVDHGTSEVKLIMNSGLFLESSFPEAGEPSPCVVEVVSIHGTSVKVTATVRYQHRTIKHCYMNEDCCDPAGIEWLGSVSFSPEIQTVTFPPRPDAADDSPQTDSKGDSSLATGDAID